MSISDDHLKLLKQQQQLVTKLKEVLAAQKHTLEELHGASVTDVGNTADYNGVDSENENEVDLFEVHTAKASGKKNAISADEPGAEEDPEATWETPDPEAVAGKPWISALQPPSDWNAAASKAKEAAPAGTLTLTHAYGYRSRGCRNNIAYCDSNTIIYPVSAVAVVHNLTNNTQTFFRGHTDDIVCLDYNATKRLVATGEQGAQARICVWCVDYVAEAKATFTNHRRAVLSVSLSADGSRLLSLGADNDHSVLIHEIASESLVHSVKVGPQRMYGVTWNTTQGASPNASFVTFGHRHLVFWDIQKSGAIDQKPAQLGRKGVNQGFLGVAFTNKHTIVGCENGDTYTLDGHRLLDVRPAHNKACFAVACDVHTNRLVTGGRDGFVNVWDAKTGKRVGTVDLNSVESLHGLNSVRAIHLDPKHPECFLVGTIAGCIYRVDVPETEGSAYKASRVVEGHGGDMSKLSHYGELLGLATHPSTATFATAGEDRALRFWDAATKKCIKVVDLAFPVTSVAYSPSGAHLAAGLGNGAVVVINTSDYNEVFRIRKHKKRAQCVRFSPDGKLLAVGTAKNVVNLYHISADGLEYTSGHTLEGNCAVILQMDFSADSKYLQTCSQAYELMYFDVELGRQLDKSGADTKDVQWATFTSILGWNVQGIWPAHSDGSDVNMVYKSNNNSLLATADEAGSIRLFQYPCIGSGFSKDGGLKRHPKALVGKAHSAHVSAIAFTSDDTTILSVGGSDQAVMQWSYTATS